MTETRLWRPAIMGARGAVATNHPVATQAGLDILRAGGSAADAIAAAALCLGVVEPHMSGLGGDGFYHVRHAGAGAVFEGAGCAPQSATLSRFAAGMERYGPLSVSPPGMLAGVGALHAEYGRLPWRDVCQSAVAAARDGFFAGHTYRRYAGEALGRLRNGPQAAKTYLRDNDVPAFGARLTNPALADTLEAIALEGWDDFYRGGLAKRFLADLDDAGCGIAPADLEATSARRRTPLAGRYRDFEVLQTPPVSSGFALLQMLAIIERFDMRRLREDPVEATHLMVEAKKLAFADRERFAGDPAHTGFELDKVLDPDRIERMAKAIHSGQAASIPLKDAWRGSGDTTYLCTVDKNGMAVSAIQSLNAPFGSGTFCPRTGILLNNRMSCWHLDAGHPNALRPGKTVRHTMNAPILLKDGRLWAVLGTPGADNQVQVNLQAIVALVDHEKDPQAACEAPRWSSDQPGQNANWPHEGANVLSMEEGFGRDTINGLRSRGHAVDVLAPLTGPCSLEIIRITDEGTKIAGSDPRRDGWAAAY